MSDTPRTNRVTRARSEIASTSVVDSDFARTLERELSASQAEVERLREAMQKLANEAFAIAEMARPCIGHTNAAVLHLRIKEAEDAIARRTLDNPAEPGA